MSFSNQAKPLIFRLKAGAYKDIYNFPQKAFDDALENEDEEEEEEEDVEMEQELEDDDDVVRVFHQLL